MTPVVDRADPSARLPGVDLLRGIAVLAVVAIHVPHYAVGGWREHPFFLFSVAADFGYLGVSLFIVISGFCIHRKAALSHLQTGRYEFDWRAFWVRRFWRLYPPYVAAIVVSLLCAAWLHSDYRIDAATIPDVVVHLLMLHNLTELSTSLGNGALWTLGMEEQLYALYAVLLLAMIRRSWTLVLASTFVVSLLWRLITEGHGNLVIDWLPIAPGSWYHWPLAYCFHWALGARAVELCSRSRPLPRFWSSTGTFLVLFSIAVLCSPHLHDLLLSTRQLAGVMSALLEYRVVGFLRTLSELVFALAFFVLVLRVNRRQALATEPGIVNRSVQRVGRISYSVYLIHVPIILSLDPRLPLDPNYWPHWPLRYAVLVPTVLLAGWAFHILFEKPFLRRGRTVGAGPAVRARPIDAAVRS